MNQPSTNLRHIKVFLSSSLSHREARDKIKNVLEERTPTSEEVVFSVYRHEENGEQGIIKYVDSQSRISAAAESHYVFMLYIGDKVGKHTIREFEEALDGRNWNMKFIYVLHNPNDVLVPEPGREKDYISWKEFEKTYMGGDKGGIYYEDQVTMEELERDVKNIRDQLASLCLLPLSPKEVEYERVVPPEQKEYRVKAYDYIPREEVDEPLAKLLGVADDRFPAPLILVHGMSLAGKTRSVTHAISQLPADKYKIHFLRGLSTSTLEVFNHIKPADQFFKTSVKAQEQGVEKWRHILFIDEISRLLFRNDGYGNMTATPEFAQFCTLCNFAEEHPDRLTIIGTTAENFDDLHRLIIANGHNEGWLTRIMNVKVDAMKADYMFNLFRRLRAQNNVDKDMVRSIKDGMPIGALFIDLRNLKIRYNSLNVINNIDGEFEDVFDTNRLDIRCIFDAIKSIWMWKFTSRSNVDLLIDYVNTVNHLEGEDRMSVKRLSDLMREKDYSGLKSFIRLAQIKNTRRFEFLTEQILVDEIFRFLPDENGQSTPLEAAVERIVGYILERYPDAKYEELFKLLHRGGKDRIDSELYGLIAKTIEDKVDFQELYRENERLAGGADGCKNWAEMLASQIAGWRIHIDGFANSFDQMRDKLSSHAILAQFVNFANAECDWDMLRPVLFDEYSGDLRQEIKSTKSESLVVALITRLKVQDAMNLYEAIDIPSIVRRWVDPTEPREEFQRNEIRIMIRVLNAILPRVPSKRSFDQVIEVFNRVNKQTGWFDGDVTLKLYFQLIKKRTWLMLSQNVASHFVDQLFDLVFDLVLPEEKGSVKPLLLRKVEILNYFLEPMAFYPAVERWRRMAPIRDSFTLMAMLKKCTDYAIARTFYDQFFAEGFGKSVRPSQILVNAMLDAAKIREDFVDMIDLYRQLGSMPPRQAGKFDRFEMLFDIDDPYLQGLLIGKENKSVPFAKKLQLLEVRRCEGKVRNYATIGKIVQQAPNFAVAERILFGPTPACLTEAEQRMLRESPLPISNLASKVSSEEEAVRFRRYLTEALENARATGTLVDFLSPAQASILTAVVHNAFLCPEMKDVYEFWHWLQSYEDSPIENAYVITKVHKRESKREDRTHQEKIEKVNEMIIRYGYLPRKNLKQMILNRNFEGFYASGEALELVELFPMRRSSGKWYEARTTVYDWMINMMEGRFLHPVIFDQMLKLLVAQAAGHPESARIKGKIIFMIKKARETGLSLNHDSMVACRGAIQGVGIREDLRPIAADYSIVKDISAKLKIGKGRYTADDAIRELREYESKYGEIHRSPTFYVSFVNYFSRYEAERSVSDILQFMREAGFSDLSITSSVIFQLMNSVKSTQEYEIVKSLVPGFCYSESGHLYGGIVRAVWKCKEAGRYEDAKKIAREAVIDKNGEILIPDDGRLAYEAAIDEELSPQESKFNLHGHLICLLKELPEYSTFDKLMDVIDEKGLTVNEKAADVLLNLITEGTQFDRFRSVYAEPLSCTHIQSLLYRISSIGPDKKRIFRQSIFERVNRPEIVGKLAATLAKGLLPPYNKKAHDVELFLINRVRRDSTSPLYQQFANFCSALLNGG